MDKKQLTRKIKRISHISLIAMVVYVVLNIIGFFPEKRSYMLNFKEHSLPGNITGAISLAAVFFCAVAGFVTAFMLLNDLSKKRTPFTLRICNLLRNLGVYFIIIEIAKAVFIFIVSREIRIELFWFAGLVLYAFSLVFRHGKRLQKQSDETL